MKWPWTRTTHQPEQEREIVSAQEIDALTRDIEQVKRVNEYILNKAIARGWIDEDLANSIRTTQSYEHEVLDLGRHIKPT